jgi:hypothetical protein
MVTIVAGVSAMTVVILIRAMIAPVMAAVVAATILVRTAIVRTMILILMRHRQSLRVIMIVCP